MECADGLWLSITKKNSYLNCRDHKNIFEQALTAPTSDLSRWNRNSAVRCEDRKWGKLRLCDGEPQGCDCEMRSDWKLARCGVSRI